MSADELVAELKAKKPGHAPCMSPTSRPMRPLVCVRPIGHSGAHVAAGLFNGAVEVMEEWPAIAAPHDGTGAIE